tara:strand:+ start:764 stop:1153 length:390 start_codon:yes stop_codon:yes gene_type:complete
MNNLELENKPDQNELQKIVKEWLMIDDEISKINQALKERKNRKKELSCLITNFMKNNEVPFFNINDGKLILAESKQKKPLNKETLFNLANNFFNNNQNQAFNLVNYINNNRESFTRERLKRKKIKEKNN